jgi:uncharacterized protein (DUF58 family)
VEREELTLLKKIRLKTGRKLNTLFVGEYHSAFKGHGLAFDSVREYQYGDSFKSVDWNVSARMNHLFIKEYIEERELSVVVMVDVSGSTEFGTGRTKRDVILEVTTLLLHLAQMNNDRISVLLFSDGVEKFIRPKKGGKFILKVLDEIVRMKPKSRHTDISGAIDFVRRVMKKRSIVFLISDFIDHTGDFQLKLRLLGKKHDIIPIQVSDPMEKEMKLFGLTEFVDLESGKVFLSDTVPEKLSFPVLADFDYIQLNTVEPIEVPMLKYFEKRNRTKLTR